MAQYFSPGVYVEDVPPVSRPIAGVGTSTPGFVGIVPDTIKLPSHPLATDPPGATVRWVQVSVQAPLLVPRLVTSWNEYVKLFGDLMGSSQQATLPTSAGASHSLTDSQQILAHAVYGFFNNGGSSCYVIRVAAETDLPAALAAFAAIDDITIVAAPGLTTEATYAALNGHCDLLKDRVALLDSAETADKASLKSTSSDSPAGVRPHNSSHAAFYYPWLQVADPASALLGTANGLRYVPPSGHIAGIYARNDATRGVFKAPANEALNGVLDLKYALSKADQDNLNPVGVNLIRPLIGAFRVWGARTIGGDANGEFRYISTRRYLNFLRESIDEGTQWVVFEPNTPALWQRIRRTLEDFLTNQWRDGALFGETAKQAFFVKCDADTNPPEVRDAGQVVTEIGVAIVKPAEFVIFRIQQTSGG